MSQHELYWAYVVMQWKSLEQVWLWMFQELNKLNQIGKLHCNVLKYLFRHFLIWGRYFKMMLSRWCPYPILSHWSWWQFFMSPTQIVLYMYCHQNQSPPNKRPVFKMPPRKCYFLCFHFRWCRISRYQNRNESSDSYFDNVKSYHL